MRGKVVYDTRPPHGQETTVFDSARMITNVSGACKVWGRDGYGAIYRWGFLRSSRKSVAVGARVRSGIIRETRW